jgi:hypothetical protein
LGGRRRVWRAAGVLGGAEQRAAGGGPLQRAVQPDAPGAREQPHHPPQEAQQLGGSQTLSSIKPPYHTPSLFDSLMK